jgi:flagellin-like protein
MFKKVWKDESAVSPVIATILMVAITVVLAGVLVVYMQQFSQGPGDQSPNGAFVAIPFANPEEGTTTNMGGWSVKVTSLTGGKPMWGEVNVMVKTAAGVNIKSMLGVKPANSDYELETSALNWYMLADAAPNYVEGGVVTVVSGNEGNIDAAEFQTVEHVWFIVMDNDADKKMSENDIVLVFKDNNADNSEDVSMGYSVEFTMSKGNIGGAPLR